ncbi:hypothetical protein N7497_005974 [Penicillium chrysogenum]|nr:hypothetical protein N7497_005974 [Penicillium chrysogenum]
MQSGRAIAGILPSPRVDQEKSCRTVPMRVLVPGLSRTGTESLRKALIQLGYDGTYHGYTAAVESPRDSYPNAKVILTNRDTDEWFYSVSKTLAANAFTRKASLISLFATITRSPNRWTRPTMMYALSDFFDGDFERNGKQTYREHYQRVREMARERKMELLDYEIKDGWEPL